MVVLVYDKETGYYFNRRTRPKPLLRGWIHRIMAFAFPVNAVALWRSKLVDNDFVNEYAVFCICCFLAVGSSALLHYKETLLPYDTIRRMDYASVFLFIGGSSLPALSAMSPDPIAAALIAFQWLAILIGCLHTLTDGEMVYNRELRLVYYLVITVVNIYQVIFTFSHKCINGCFFISLALIAHISGVLIYGFRFPNPFPGVFGYHEVFHVCCALGFGSSLLSNHHIVQFCKAKLL